jgi:hypothetical protein
MNRAAVVLGGLLCLSLLFNIAALARKNPLETARPSSQGPAAAPERVDTAVPPTMAPREAKPLTSDPLPAAVRTSPSAPSRITDPVVLEVLDAQDSFAALWKDLDRLYKVRERLDEEKFLQSVLSISAQYLELDELRRNQFSEIARGATKTLFEARKELDAARKALPPKNKGDAAWQAQKDAVDARYDAAVTAAVDGLRTCLDTTRSRHVEFASHADKWLRNLAPRPPQ